MRRLTFLVLVGFFAAAANGALMILVDGQNLSEVTITPSDTVVVDVTDSIGVDGVWYIGFFDAREDTFALSEPYPQDPHILTVPPKPPYLNGWIEFEINQNWLPGQTPAPGQIFEINLTCLAEGDVYVELLDGANYSVIDTLIIHQIPEPMTLGLFGLGALLIRRRR